jgi:uncharacterized protein (DUF952 family)
VSILHLAHVADWAQAQSDGEYRWSSRGTSLEQEGFIHCSTPEQVGGVAARFYADDPNPLVVLVLDEAAIATSGIDLIYEDGGNGELFPHIYGPISPAWVTAVRPAQIVNGVLEY